MIDNLSKMINESYDIVISSRRNLFEIAESLYTAKEVFEKKVAREQLRGVEGKNVDARKAKLKELCATEEKAVLDADERLRRAKVDHELNELELARARALLRLAEIESRRE